jgi:hypothetical protein
MNDLRHDINEVFAKEQGQLGDAAGTGNRMLRAATAGRRVNRQLWPSVAGIALVLVAAAAIGVSVVVRGLHPRNVVTNHPSPTPIATPTATPAPTPMSQQLHVPDTTPVILFHDPVDVQQIDGVTWDGSSRGRVATNPELGNGFSQNPAGTLYHWMGGISDRTGAVVPGAATPFKGFGTWADDGQHYCSMVSKSTLPPAGGEPATLQLTAVGQAPKNVVQVGRMYDQSSTGVAACSIEKDRAIVVHSGSAGNTLEFWVVQLSTGRIMWTRSYSADGASVDVRTSRDGQYIAENKSNCCPATKTTTTIYGPTGAVLGHPAGFVEEFSWDGSLAVMGTFNAPVSVVRWRDGTVVWNGPSGDGFLGAMPEPGGQSIAISVSNPEHPQTGGFYPGDIYIVGPDGRATELIKNVVL